MGNCRLILNSLFLFSLIVFISACSGQSDTTSNAQISGTTSKTTATLSWMPPSQNIDSTPVDLAGYRIYYGTSEGDYSNVIDITNPGLSEYMIENLDPGTYYFVVTAYDTLGEESAYSNVASVNLI